MVAFEENYLDLITSYEIQKYFKIIMTKQKLI